MQNLGELLAPITRSVAYGEPLLALAEDAPTAPLADKLLLDKHRQRIFVGSTKYLIISLFTKLTISSAEDGP